MAASASRLSRRAAAGPEARRPPEAGFAENLLRALGRVGVAADKRAGSRRDPLRLAHDVGMQRFTHELGHGPLLAQDFQLEEHLQLGLEVDGRSLHMIYASIYG